MTASSLMNEAEPLLTPAEVATLFRVDAKTVTRWEQAGKLSSFRTLGGHRRYREAEVRALLTGSARVPDQLAAPLHTLWPAGGTSNMRSRLAGMGIATVGKLTALDADGLRGMGFRSAQVDEIRLALYRKGLALRGEVADIKAA